MSSTAALKNTMLDSIPATKIRLHSGVTTDGTQNTITLTTAGLAESNATWGASADNAGTAERDLSATVSIANLPAGAVVSHFSFWNGTTYLGSKAFDASETYTNADGTANITSAKFTLADVA